MVKSNSPNTPSTWLISLCPSTHGSLHTCRHSAFSVLAVPISSRVITVCVQKARIAVITASTRNSSDAGSASKPKWNHHVLSISEKGKILGMMVIGGKIVRGDCCMARMNLPFVKWWGTKKELHCSIGDCMARTNLPFVKWWRTKKGTSLFYRRLRIILKRQNTLLSYVRDRIHCKSTR
jgi:hypothetical protein